jgi:hypothetical protein
MSNPLVDQGVLSRLVASTTLDNFPELNVTASYLGKEGIKLALEGEAATYINTMTGGVPSPEPYQICNVTIYLLKTQPLSAQYKAQYETNVLLGNMTVRPDVSFGLTPYDLTNCSLVGIAAQDYSGRDAGWTVSIRGYYEINGGLYQ